MFYNDKLSFSNHTWHLIICIQKPINCRCYCIALNRVILTMTFGLSLKKIDWQYIICSLLKFENYYINKSEIYIKRGLSQSSICMFGNFSTYNFPLLLMNLGLLVLQVWKLFYYSICHFLFTPLCHSKSSQFCHLQFWIFPQASNFT